MKENILYLRNFASSVDLNSYNLQEIGLCKELVKCGYNCDIVYYSEEKEVKEEVIFEYQSKKLRLLWIPSIKIFNNSIFPKVLNHSFLGKYNTIITTEYSQIMTFLLSLYKKRGSQLFLYHGPYKDEGKLLIRRIYDYCFLKKIIRKVDKVFVKSNLAKNYLQNKGFIEPITLGVGLDTDNLINSRFKKEETDLGFYNGKKVILYVGKLEDRKNIQFLISVFAKLHCKYNDLILLLIGNGSTNDIEKYTKVARELEISNSIVHLPKVSQEDIGEYYEKSEIFVLPSKYEIFGMVLLECLYYELPVVTSYNGGSDTLITNYENGIKINNFDEKQWMNAIEYVLNNVEYREASVSKGKVTLEEFNWSKIAKKITKYI